MVKPLKKLRVGVIGCGRISVIHFDAVKLCGGVRSEERRVGKECL